MGGLLVGAYAQVLGDGVNDITVTCGLLSDVQLHHTQPKTLHLQSLKGLNATSLRFNMQGVRPCGLL